MPGKQTQMSWLLPSPGSTPPSWEHHLSNSPTIHFFTNWEVGAHFLKFFPGPVASFLPSPHLPHQHQWRPPSAALDLALLGGPHPCCAPPHPPPPRLMAELQGFPQPVPRLCAGKKAGFLGLLRANWFLLYIHQQLRCQVRVYQNTEALAEAPKHEDI